MKRIFKRVVAVALSCMVVLSMAITASASSGYARNSMKGSYAYTKYNCTFWTQSNFWDVSWGAKGTSRTAWVGLSPYNADSITHKDILSCSGIGSMGIGASPSGPNASASLSGHSATYTYVVSNDWFINIDFNYKHTGLLAVWNCSMRTAATVQFGSNFYSFGN